MGSAKVLFDIIDVVCNKDQNGKSYGDIQKEIDIVYDDSHAYGKLDLYAKEFDSSIKHPLIINYHGGGFVAGDKKYRLGMADYFVNNLADEKVYYLNANYRLANGKDVTFPTPVCDCANVLKWVEDNAEKYNFDMDNIFLSGDSAGAYMAIAMLNNTLNNDYAERIGSYKSHLKIKGGFFGCGPYNILSALNTKLFGMNLGKMVGKPVTGLKDITEDSIASYNMVYEIEPMNYVSAEYPVIYFVHAEYDEFCPGHGKTCIAKLKELGIDVWEYYLAEKQMVNHCFFLSQGNKEGAEALQKGVEYFKAMINK